MSAFSPTAAVVIHSHVVIEDAVLSTLQAEEGILIESCQFTATRPRISRSDINGREFLVVYGPLDAVWSVKARVLSRTGLSDYHPGRLLSERSLAFANAGFVPFQVGMTAEENQNGQAVLIYENPSLDPQPGDLPAVDFQIRIAFGDEDTLNFPITNPDPPDLPTNFVEIPAQDAVELTAEYRSALMSDAFTGTDSFGSAPLTATLFSGSPTGDGVQIMGPLDLTAWTAMDEPTLFYQTRARNQSLIQWNDANFSDVVCTHVRLARNGIVARDIALAAPLAIPAYYGVQSPINALGVLLTWPIDGAAYSAAAMPSRVFATYAMGGSRATAVPDDVLYITWWDGDPQAGGISLDTLVLIPADASNFPVTGVTMTPTEQTGANLAPGGGWDGDYVTINFFALHTIVKEQYVKSAPNGFPLTLNATPPPALLKLDLAATPDP